MDPLVQEETARVHAESVISYFELDVMSEIADWLMTQKNWLATYGSVKNATEIFWENRLN